MIPLILSHSTTATRKQRFFSCSTKSFIWNTLFVYGSVLSYMKPHNRQTAAESVMTGRLMGTLSITYTYFILEPVKVYPSVKL